ncbi:MAG: SH3 domain-containing protein [Caldilineaceae bacterium]
MVVNSVRWTGEQMGFIPTRTPTNTPTVTYTPTVTPTPTETPLPTATSTSTNTPLPTNTSTATPIPSATPLPTDTPLSTSTPTRPPLPTNTSVPTVAAQPQNGQFVANQSANLRGGPSTDYGVVGNVANSDKLEVIGKVGDGSWYQLANGAWIAAFLVNGDGAGVTIVNAPPLPVQATLEPAAIAPAPASAPSTSSSDGEPFVCDDGCAVPPDPSCAIKGNVNSRGDKIYHAPGFRDYEKTDVKPEEGDRWFCTEEEARAAGFRAPKNH